MAKSITPQRGAAKTVTTNIDATAPLLRKPDWIRIKLPTDNSVQKLKHKLRQHQLHTVCEEATCPNLNECFAHGTATFMIMGDICTRRCPFCDVAHGRPAALNSHEPQQLAQTVLDMGLKYVVITSVNRDDLRDGGAQHFADCINALRAVDSKLKIEILVPDFRGRADKAIAILSQFPPDVFNHNLETVERLYTQVRPGADYQLSLQLLLNYKAQAPVITTKSGLMLGLGETMAEIEQVMRDLRNHDCDMLTLGQYLQPSRHHLPVQRYVTPAEFAELADLGYALGFKHVASAPLVRSSYQAESQLIN